MLPVGFEVTFVDGTKFTERDGFWDDVPKNKKIQNLAVVDFDSGAVLASASPGSRYFFTNEAIAYPGKQVLSGKILGSVQGATVTEVRWEVWPEQKVVSREYPVSECPFGSGAFRGE
jgi:hypothetical protein